MRRLILPALGLALLVLGVVLVVTQGVPDDFGWFAYSPLPDDYAGGTAISHVRFVSDRQLHGELLAALGLAALTAYAGFRLGRRHAA